MKLITDPPHNPALKGTKSVIPLGQSGATLQPPALRNEVL